jgi:hypothetical protein
MKEGTTRTTEKAIDKSKTGVQKPLTEHLRCDTIKV